MKNYLKIGLICSLVVHVGFFALGGYVMDNITKSLKDNAATMQNLTADDITYADVQTNSENTDEDITVDDAQLAEAESEVTIASDTMQDIPEVESSSAKEDISDNSQMANQEPNNNTKNRKWRTHADVGVPVGEIPPSPFRLDSVESIKDSRDLMPTIANRLKPIYDYSLIPEGVEVQVVIEFAVDDTGKVTMVNTKYSSRESDIGLSDEQYTDLDVACEQAVANGYKIIPPKDKRSNGSGQDTFILTHDGPRWPRNY